jgi:hypothetical protein
MANTPYYTKAEADAKNSSTYNEIKLVTESISAGEGGKLYDTLADAEAVNPKPVNGTVFQVSKLTDPNNAGIYTFQSAEVNGVRFERLNLNTTDKVTSNNKFNPKDYVAGYYIHDVNGNQVSRALASSTKPIKVSEGQHLFFSGFGDYFKVHKYTNDNFQGHLGMTSPDNTTEYIVEAGVEYLAFNLVYSNGADVSGTFKINYDSLKSYDVFENKNVLENVTIEYKDLLATPVSLPNKITIKNSDKIAVFGNSYTNGYPIYKKHYLDNLSMFSDYQFRNFGKSGDDLTKIMERIRNNSTWLGAVPISDWGITYGIIACRDNNAPTYNMNIETYYEGTKKLAKEIETLGGVPILSTEHQIMTQGLFNGLERLSKENNYMFMNWGRLASKLRNNKMFSPFWKSGHPATRTNWLWFNGMKPYIDSLPKVEKGIKLFRVRNSVVINSVSDLVYETVTDRAIKFEELAVGQLSLTQATEEYFDRLNEGGVYVDYNDEYQDLQAGNPVSVGDYFLAEFIIPYTSTNTTSFKVKFSGSGVNKVYVKKILGLTSYLSSDGTSTEYQNNFKNPVGEWYELNIVDNEIELPAELFLEAINYDKASILFEGSSMVFTNIEAETTGEKEKNRLGGRVPDIYVGNELLTDTLLDDGTAWYGDTGFANINTVPSVQKIVDTVSGTETEDFPSGINTVREINGSSILRGVLTDVNESYRDCKVQIKIICRYFPSYVNDTSKWGASEIKRGTYDCSNISVFLQNFNSTQAIKVCEKPIGLYWEEVVIEGHIETGTNQILVKALDKPIQIASVSVVKI